MEVMVSCMQCQVENGIPNFSDIRMHRIPDGGAIKLRCNRGHDTITIIQAHKFELLSELAILAIKDGYYREAVASFAACLERFYEFYIEILCRHRNIPADQFTAAWKHLKNSSERQFGAFSMAYLLENSAAPTPLPNAMIEFRNGVIHKGRFPDRSEAVKYGQAVADCILPWLLQLKSDAFEIARLSIIGDHIKARREAANASGLMASTMALSCALSLSLQDTGLDVERAVEDRVKRPRL